VTAHGNQTAGTGAPVGKRDLSGVQLTAGLVLTVSMTAFEALAVATALPATVADIGGLELYGWTFSGFMLSNLVGITMAGAAADRRGVARPFVAGSALFVFGLVGGGLAPSMLLLVINRMVQGLGAGAISATAYVAVARAYPADERPRLLALLSSAWVVPGLIGPALAGMVTDHVGWRWVFLGLAPPTAGASILAIRPLRRLGLPARGTAAPVRTLAAIRLAAGTGLLLFALGGRSVPFAAALVVAGVAVGRPALRELVPPGTLRARAGLPAAIATMGLVSFAFFGAEVFVPLSLTAVRGQSTTMAGLALTAATISWTAGAWIQARLARRRRHSELATVGVLLTVVGIVGTAAVLNPAVPSSLAAPMWGVAGLGMGLAYSTTALAVLEAAPAGGEGEASAAMQLANVLGVALGAGLGGGLLALVTFAGGSVQVGIALADLMAIGAWVLCLPAARRLATGR
jgi:MFS family permease